MCLEINITNRKELSIYMNVQRQRLLKIMEISGVPMTPKQLSLKLDISPSSVTYHLKKLETLGLVQLDHMESIHGIQANFYRKVPAHVNLRGDVKDDLYEEKMVLADYIMDDIWKRFKLYLADRADTSPGDAASSVSGDCVNGTFYLTDEEAKELNSLLQAFQKNHLTPGQDTKPWEIALIAFPEKQ